MTDDRKHPQGPFDFQALFGGAAEAGAKSGVAASAAEAAHDGAVDPIAERCRKMALEVQSEQQVGAHNLLRPCRGEIEIPPCKELQLPDIRLRFYVFWGNSVCDCVESDDTEVMTILVYNPYRNLRLCNVEINRIRVVKPDGSAVPNLPDGSPSITVVPRGHYCFGDLGPCSFAYRQFVLRLRGAVAGPYRILLEGICYELCMTRMTEECMMFDVCKD
jgi:hypothetical protein